ncbi:MAG TPA: arylsulfatase [Acidimicrobiia bacterium]
MRDPVTPPSMETAARVAPAPTFRRDAPNVMVVVFDDLGFAHLGAYGSDLATPNVDALAARGLRFTNFHTTAVCSPTRSCLLTGRNHHRVGMGMLPDLPTNFPGYSCRFPRGAGTLAQILHANGYATFCVGKWHLVARDQRVTGPYDMWPTGLGFDRYYGFLNGETNQWTPNLVRDTNHVEPPRTPDGGYHLDADLADNAIAYLHELRLSHPDRPFLLWYASAAPHAPHQAPPEWIDRFRGQFDDGWDAWRGATLTRQQQLGVVGSDTELSERPSWVEPWSEIDAPRRRLYARMMEVCAGYIAHADHQLGRVFEHLAASGELDNTIVMFVSDNGASGEGGPHGTYNQLGHYISDEADDLADELAHFDDLGGFRSSGHYPWGWALAGNTPFRRWKRYTFEGGVRDPFVIAAPAIRDAGGLRDQYCHAVDVLPTVLELCGIEPPSELAGVPQLSLDGTSLVPVLQDPNAATPRVTQYYECWGSRAMYHDGWKAVTNHVNQLTAAERDAMTGSHDFADDTWALYDTRADPAESHDLAAEEPERLSQLVSLWFAEAERNQVFPLDDGAMHRIAHMHVPWTAYRPSFQLRAGDKVHEVAGPNIAGGFRMVAAFRDGIGDAGAGRGSTAAVLCEQGDWTSGWAWYVAGGALHWCIAGKGGVHGVEAVLPPSARIVVAEGRLVDGAFEVSLAADDLELARAQLDVHPPLAWSPDGAFLTVGYARPFPVSDDYEPPAAAPASLVDITITVGPLPPLDVDAELARIFRHQ